MWGSRGVFFAMTWVLLQVTAAPSVCAQDQGGTIYGVVRDPSQSAVPDTVVDLQSPSSPGIATVISDRDGAYRLPSLRPGVYELTATHAGFRPIKMPGIVLTLGAEFRIDLNLVLAEVTQVVQVMAEPPLLDMRQNAAIYAVDQQTIPLLLAPNRNFTDLLTMAAGVQSARSGLSIGGSTGPENSYVVNGVRTNDVVIGVSAQTVPLQFIDQIQITSNGYSAEHGASIGGVVNVVTKNGGDRFHGSVGSYFADPNFRWNGSYRPSTRFSPIDNRTPEVFVNQTDARTRSPHYEWLGDAGGPIRKQRIWFYVSNSSTYVPSARTVLFSAAPQDGPTRFTSYESSLRLGGALTAVITPKLRTRLTSQIDHARVRRSLPGQMQPDGYTTLANPATRFDLTGEDQPSRLLSAHLDYVANRRLFINSRLGYLFTDRFDVKSSYVPELRHTFGRSNIGLAGVAPELQFAAGYTSTPLTNVARVKAQLTRLAWDLNATYFASWKGQHAIKGGFNAEWVGDDILSGNTAPNISLQWDQSFATPDNRAVRGPFGYYSVQQSGTFGKVNGNVVGLFVQDSWQPNRRLTVNAGVRTERELIPSYDPALPDVRFDFGDKLAPRVGAAWDVTGDAHWKAYGSYGGFFDITKLRLARFHFGGEVLRTYYYSLDTADWPTVRCRSVGPPPSSGCSGEYYGYVEGRVAANAAGETRIDPNLEPSSTREYVLGLDRQLGTRTTVGARYVRRSLSRLVEDVGISQVTATSSQIIYKICNPGFGICEQPMADYRLPDGRPYPLEPIARRDYDALELRLTRRLSQNLHVNGNYTWSYLRGNISGLGNEDSTETGVPNITSNFDTIFMGYDARGQQVVGRLPHDRPHVFKAQGAYTFRWGTSVAVNYLAASGLLESTTISQRGRYTFINGRGDLGRVETLSQTDVRLQHDVRLWRDHRLNVAVDVQNVFDQQAVVDIGNSPYRDGFTIPDGVYFSSTGFDLASYVAAFRAGANDPLGLNNLRSDPFYGKPQGAAAYQSRRMIQCSATYRF
jgi:hypothetical protein